jgi:hypothetical protein
VHVVVNIVDFNIVVVLSHCVSTLHIIHLTVSG